MYAAELDEATGRSENKAGEWVLRDYYADW